MKHTLIVAANSGIATEFARRVSQEKGVISIVGRDSERLARLKADLCARGAEQVHQFTAELDDSDSRLSLITEVLQVGLPDVVLFAGGVLPDEQKGREDYRLFAHAFEVNFHSIVHLTSLLLPHLVERGSGTLAFISSVAGDRARASNFIYGSSKAALSAYSDGLRLGLEGTGVKVFTIKPGFVRTAMTEHLDLGPLAIEAERAGSIIYSAMKGNGRTVYVPWFWSIIMGTLRILPEFIFKRLPI